METQNTRVLFSTKELNPGQELTHCVLLINKIKKFRYNKTKLRQTDKFNRLSNKISRYMYNSGLGTFGRHRLFGGNMFFSGHSNNRLTRHYLFHIYNTKISPAKYSQHSK